MTPSFYPDYFAVDAFSLKGRLDEFGVEGIIFQVQNSKRGFHLKTRFIGCRPLYFALIARLIADDSPVGPYPFDNINKLMEIDWFHYIAVCAELVPLGYILIFVG